jgi:hypothetical protein
MIDRIVDYKETALYRVRHALCSSLLLRAVSRSEVLRILQDPSHAPCATLISPAPLSSSSRE